MRVSVMVPTFRRTADLSRCLAGLRRQTRMPDEVLLVVRRSDEETRAFLEPMVLRGTFGAALRVVWTETPGQVNALNAGLEAVAGEIVMITDDDAVPQPEWVARVEAHFAREPDLAGVGGRDVVHHGEVIEERPVKLVGQVQWFGRLVGNHHLIAPGSTYVDVLKGANMSYRMSAVGETRFDTQLRGAGAQVSNDMAFSLALRKRGWRLLYDPEARVDHFPAQRFDNDQRGKLDLQAAENMAYNVWWTLHRHLPAGPRQRAALLWEGAVGTQARPGAVRRLAARAKGDGSAVALGASARKARREAALAFEAWQREGGR